MRFSPLQRTCALGALALAPLSASTPEEAHAANEAALMVETAEIAGFESHFAPLLEKPKPDLAIPDHAVDLSAIEPAIEQDRVIRHLGTGTASYYGRRFHGRRTANGERFDMRAMTAAHRTLPFGSFVRVTNPRNGREVTVRINDRGPFARGRSIDLSRAAAEEIGMIRRGHARVEMELIER